MTLPLHPSLHSRHAKSSNLSNQMLTVGYGGVNHRIFILPGVSPSFILIWSKPKDPQMTGGKSILTQKFKIIILH